MRDVLEPMNWTSDLDSQTYTYFSTLYLIGFEQQSGFVILFCQPAIISTARLTAGDAPWLQDRWNSNQWSLHKRVQAESETGSEITLSHTPTTTELYYERSACIGTAPRKRHTTDHGPRSWVAIGPSGAEEVPPIGRKRRGSESVTPLTIRSGYFLIVHR